jgi:hypothetical protein
LGGSGSLALSPLDAGGQSKGEVPPFPFFVGNPSLDQNAVYHVLDDITLSVLLLELDTITDLTRYLDRKTALLNGGHLMGAHGEEDLLALYLKDIGPDGDHDFVRTTKQPLQPGDMLVVEGGTYDHLRNRDEYKRKKRADRVSYLWDHLIERFANVILEDTAYVVRGYEGFHEPSKRELGLRHMALTHRLARRSHSEAIQGAFDRLGKADRFFRAMLPGPTDNDDTGFFILLLKRGGKLSGISDEDYRTFRSSIMHAYALNLLRLQRNLKRVVGIATEGELDRRLRSEDLIYAEQPSWTPDYELEVEQAGSELGIFKDGIPKGHLARRVRPLEYPPTHHKMARGRNPIPYSYEQESGEPAGNRAARRAALARKRRDRRGFR